MRSGHDIDLKQTRGWTISGRRAPSTETYPDDITAAVGTSCGTEIGGLVSTRGV
jgi:hypothetical protein